MDLSLILWLRSYSWLTFKEKFMPKVLNVVLFHFKPVSEKGCDWEPWLEPIHIASDFDILSLQPELSVNLSMVLNNYLNEASDPSIKQVESSANKLILSWLFSTGMPFIWEFCLIAKAIVSITNKNRYGDMGHPWKTPLSISIGLSYCHNLKHNFSFQNKIPLSSQ